MALFKYYHVIQMVLFGEKIYKQGNLWIFIPSSVYYLQTMLYTLYDPQIGGRKKHFLFSSSSPVGQCQRGGGLGCLCVGKKREAQGTHLQLRSLQEPEKHKGKQELEIEHEIQLAKEIREVYCQVADFKKNQITLLGQQSGLLGASAFKMPTRGRIQSSGEVLKGCNSAPLNILTSQLQEQTVAFNLSLIKMTKILQQEQIFDLVFGAS